MYDPTDCVTEDRRTLRTCCKCAVICFVLILVCVAIQAATGATLAVWAQRAPAADIAANSRAMRSYALLGRIHRLVRQAMLVPAVGLLAPSALFSLTAGNFYTKHTRYAWMQIVKSSLLIACVAGTCLGARCFVVRLRTAGLWLLGESDLATSEPGIDMAAYGLSGFYAFVALHAVVLPVLAVIVVIIMWAPFWEFMRGQGPAARTKWLELEALDEEEMKIERRSQDSLPDGWKSMAGAARERRLKGDDCDDGRL